MRIPNPRRILIVISIIALLILGGAQMARRYSMRAKAREQVWNLFTTLKHYVKDTGSYPGMSYKDDQNAFPALFLALCGEKGKGGGPNAPYLEFKESDIAVREVDAKAYRKATREEIQDPKVDKYMLDPWGEPIIYRENRSRPFKPYMYHHTEADIYSTGPDRQDQSGPGSEEDEGEGHFKQVRNDDIGNW